MTCSPACFPCIHIYSEKFRCSFEGVNFTISAFFLGLSASAPILCHHPVLNCHWTKPLWRFLSHSDLPFSDFVLFQEISSKNDLGLQTRVAYSSVFPTRYFFLNFATTNWRKGQNTDFLSYHLLLESSWMSLCK